MTRPNFSTPYWRVRIRLAAMGYEPPRVSNHGPRMEVQRRIFGALLAARRMIQMHGIDWDKE